ncbi:hypothetical protein LJR034_004657 [Caballeronia sp. LjRoot34]|uniref:hypothetical protein n=1 Tax=Caballeronia sp. LjRoot34 TaxID=3342325 RepID=UPI003ECE87A0
MQRLSKSKQNSPESIPDTSTDSVVESKQQIPLMYFDSVAGLAFGPFVSRIVLGVQQLQGTGHKPQIEPGLTIVMPTAALHHLAREIGKTLDNPEHRKALEQAFANYQDNFPTGKVEAVKA